MPVGIGLSVFLWLLELWMHISRIGGGGLVQEILHPDPYKVRMWSLVCFIIVSFSVYPQIIIKRLMRAVEYLLKLRDELGLRVRERTAE